MQDLDVIRNISELTGLHLRESDSLIRLDEFSYTIDTNSTVTGLNLSGLMRLQTNKADAPETDDHYISSINTPTKDDDDNDRLFGSSLKRTNEQLRNNFTFSDLLKNIATLQSLTYLDLSKNNIENIDHLSNLKLLTWLDVSYNNISDINFVRNMTLLEQMDISNNNIISIDELFWCKNLIAVCTNNNKIEEIPEWFVDFLFPEQNIALHVNIIKRWKEGIVKTQNYELAAKVREYERNLIKGERIKFDHNILESYQDHIILKNNPIVSPPISILAQTKSSVINYFKSIQTSNGRTSPLFEIKLLVIGEGGTGKTSFMRKIRRPNANLPKDGDTTLGIEVNRWIYYTSVAKESYSERAKIYVNIWDFGGQKIYQGTHQLFFSKQSLYVLVAETREQKTDFSYWLNTVKQLGGDNSSVIIIINKKYGHELKIDQDGYYHSFGNLIKNIIEVDLSDDIQHIINMQEKVKDEIKNMPGIRDEVAPAWLDIRANILDIEANFISFDRFRDICHQYNITDNDMIVTISEYFSRLGVFTHYIDDHILMDRIYLNSNWLVKTIYRVIDNDVVKINKGRITLNDVKNIWNDNEIKHEIPKLTQLMDKFGLMYHIKSTYNYVVPAHLPTTKPYAEWPHANKENILYFLYKFNSYMPKGIMSQAIVSLHKYITNHNLVWHMGVNISLHESHAEIIEKYGNDNRFEIRIAGNNKIELLSIIREKFFDILSPFNGLEYNQLIPCVCNECINSKKPAFHNYNRLLRFRDMGRPSQCDITGELVDVEKILKITEAHQHHYNTHTTINNTNNQHNIKTIKIFLASSSELEEDRKAIREALSVENDKLHNKGIYIKLIQWEYFIDHMSQTRLQDEYNKAVSDSDIFLSIFFTKVGKFTAEEFETAFGAFKKAGKPKIYTYFKDGFIKYGEIIQEDILSKFAFERKLQELGHFKTTYSNTSELINHFSRQLDITIQALLNN